MRFAVTSDGQDVAVMESGQSDAGIGGQIPAAGANPFAEEGDADAPVVFFVPPSVRATEEDEVVNVALETARGFKKRVKLSTTLRRLKRICLPHGLATLTGVAPELSGILYRISETVHVIRIDEHYMDVTLESDGTVPAPTAQENHLQGVI
jgi:hypothetical protein